MVNEYVPGAQTVYGAAGNAINDWFPAFAPADASDGRLLVETTIVAVVAAGALVAGGELYFGVGTLGAPAVIPAEVAAEAALGEAASIEMTAAAEAAASQAPAAAEATALAAQNTAEAISTLQGAAAQLEAELAAAEQAGAAIEVARLDQMLAEVHAMIRSLGGTPW